MVQMEPSKRWRKRGSTGGGGWSCGMRVRSSCARSVVTHSSTIAPSASAILRVVPAVRGRITRMIVRSSERLPDGHVHLEPSRERAEETRIVPLERIELHESGPGDAARTIVHEQRKHARAARIVAHVDADRTQVRDQPESDTRREQRMPGCIIDPPESGY